MAIDGVKILEQGFRSNPRLEIRLGVLRSVSSLCERYGNVGHVV